METYRAILTEMFEAVEPEFRAAQIKYHQELANQRAADFVKIVLALENDPAAGLKFHRIRIPHLVTFTSGSLAHWLPEYVKAAKSGRFVPDLQQAERDANAMVDNAKLQFVHKLAKKLTNATKLRNDNPKVTGHLSLNGPIVTGWLKAEFPNSDQFSLTMKLIHNYRYGGRGGYTSFYQFPARFCGVRIGGVAPVARLSEGWMKENFK